MLLHFHFQAIPPGVAFAGRQHRWITLSACLALRESLRHLTVLCLVAPAFIMLSVRAARPTGEQRGSVISII